MRQMLRPCMHRESPVDAALLSDRTDPSSEPWAEKGFWGSKSVTDFRSPFFHPRKAYARWRDGSANEEFIDGRSALWRFSRDLWTNGKAEEQKVEMRDPYLSPEEHRSSNTAGRDGLDLKRQNNVTPAEAGVAGSDWGVSNLRS